LYLGHLYPQKGVDILIEALKYLPDGKLLIVGGNKKEDISRIKNLSSHIGVDKQVIFAGCVPHCDIGKYFNGAGVSVIPIVNTMGQRLFTSPMKLFEYMAAKIPIVASDFPSMREILENGKTAVLVESENPKALAEGIEKILTDRDFARKICEQAYEKVKNFTWEKRAEKITIFLRNVLKTDKTQ
ncbi:glycosyltransferase family 4 protein, partial [bacterium]|nr:glycosyltransferase family 4 protein [bacterium]